MNPYHVSRESLKCSQTLVKSRFFNDFIQNAKSETEIKNNREIWHHYPEIFNEDSETGFVEIATEEIFRKFKIPYHDYKNDGKFYRKSKASHRACKEGS